MDTFRSGIVCTYSIAKYFILQVTCLLYLYAFCMILFSPLHIQYFTFTLSCRSLRGAIRGYTSLIIIVKGTFELENGRVRMSVGLIGEACAEDQIC